LRPPPVLLGRPIRLCDRIDGTGLGARIVTFICVPLGRDGSVLSPSPMLYFELTVLPRDDGVPEPGRGGGGIVVGRLRSRSRGSGGGGGGGIEDRDVLAPNTPSDERFAEYGLFGAAGPVDRLSPGVPEWAYTPPDGIGRKVGVAGREEAEEADEGMETVVEPPESRDCGRFRPL